MQLSDSREAHVNNIAAIMYQELGFSRAPGYRFDLSANKHELLVWRQAHAAFEYLENLFKINTAVAHAGDIAACAPEAEEELLESDYTSIFLTPKQKVALNEIYTHLKSLKPGHGISFHCSSGDFVLFLCPIEEQKCGFSSITAIPADYAGRSFDLPDAWYFLDLIIEARAENMLVEYSNNCESLKVAIIDYWDEYMQKLKAA